MPITQVASIMNVLQSTAASAERVFELLDEPEEEPDAAECVLFEHTRGHIELEDVSFRYVAGHAAHRGSHPRRAAGRDRRHRRTHRRRQDHARQPAAALLRDRRTAASSSTASTRRDITRSDLRRLFGMVLQDTWLFSGTIRENIAYGREGATEDEIRAAAKAARVDHFVRALPDGYDTRARRRRDQRLARARSSCSPSPAPSSPTPTSSSSTRPRARWTRAPRC